MKKAKRTNHSARRFLVLALAVCVLPLLSILVSCNSTASTLTVPGTTTPETTQAPVKTTAPATKPIPSTSPSSQPSTNENDNNYGIGGGELNYKKALSLDLSVDPIFGEFAGWERFEEWTQQFTHFNPNGTRESYEYNLYTLITELEIPEETVRDFCREYKEKLEHDYFPEQVLDWIFEGNKEAVYQYYLMPGTILVGDRCFTPKWLVEHSYEEYLEAGLTSEILEENLGKVLAACETEEQRTAITNGQIQLQKLEKTVQGDVDK